MSDQLAKYELHIYNDILLRHFTPQTSFSNEISEMRIRAVYKVYMPSNSQVINALVFENAFGTCTEYADGIFGCMAMVGKKTLQGILSQIVKKHMETIYSSLFFF